MKFATGFFAFLLLTLVPAGAVDFPVGSDADLRAAVLTAGDSDTIIFTGNITLLAELPALQKSITIDGGDHDLDGDNQFRGFFVANFGGGSALLPVAVTIRNLSIRHTRAQGGMGQKRGGGGAGLGGALFVADSATVTVENTTFTNNSGIGGAGGAIGDPQRGGSGGGGGMGGDGGAGVGFTGAAGGGGLGLLAAGGATFAANGNPGSIATGAAAGGSATGGAGTGGANGGGGGAGWPNQHSGGGGGIGGGNGMNFTGGRGGFGGGGGGSVGGPGGTGGFGGGGGSGSGGTGTNGFGGFGGGGGGFESLVDNGGGTGGFGAGAGDIAGGGGLGAGGGIFVQRNGHLIVAGSCSMLENSVAPGTSGGGNAGNGSAFGSGIFFEGDGQVTFQPAGNQTQTVSDNIADQSGSGGIPAFPGSAGLIKSGSGKLVLTGTNTYTGGTAINEGELAIGAANTLPSTGTVTIGAGGALSLTLYPQAIASLAGEGTLSLGVGILTVGDDDSDSRFAGTIEGNSGGIVKVGTGTLTIVPAYPGLNTYAGTTTISEGTLGLGYGASTGSSRIILRNGAVLVPGTGNTIGALTWDGGGTLEASIGSGASPPTITRVLEKGAAGTYAIALSIASNGFTDVIPGQTYTILYFGSNDGFTASDFVVTGYTNGTLAVTQNALTFTIPATPIPPTYGVTMSVAKGRDRATYTIANTGNVGANFRIAQSIRTTANRHGPKPPKPPKPSPSAFDIVTTLNGANVSKSIATGTTATIAAGGSAQVVVKIKTRRKIEFKRSIRILLTATSPAATASSQATLDLKASR